MSKYGELFKVFQKPIGQNLDNDPDDIINVKNKLSVMGRYHDPYKSGYIDAELANSIRSYQRDRNLKSDGVILPGGETEATLLGELIDPSRVNTSSNKIAMAPTVPWIIGGATKVAKKGWDIWKILNPSERQDEVEKAYDECYEEYKGELSRCDYITEKYGKNAGRVCFEEAAENLAECQKPLNRNR